MESEIIRCGLELMAASMVLVTLIVDGGKSQNQTTFKEKVVMCTEIINASKGIVYK